MTTAEAIKFSKSQIKGLATNLSSLLKANNLSESALAIALNIPPLTIRRLSSGETLDPHVSTLKQIADYFDVSMDSLIETSGSHFMPVLQKKSMPTFLPILKWSIASEIESVNDLDLASWKEWQPVTLNEQYQLSEASFALESKPSMAPRFPVGTLFIIDPLAEPIDGDLVLIKIRQDSGLSIREITIDPPRWQLKPTILGSETLFYSSEEHQIIGPVLMTLLYSRR